jgi:hypothetical protein
MLDVESEKLSVTIDPAAQLIVKSIHPLAEFIDCVVVGATAPPQLVRDIDDGLH